MASGSRLASGGATLAPTPTQVRTAADAASSGAVFVDPAGAVARPTRRADYLANKRKLCRTLMGGTEAMRAAGREFLPQHPAESDGSYALRLNATTLYNGFAETVKAQSSKFFGEPVTLTESVDPALMALAENIDGQGRALTPFCIDLTVEAMVDGISCILVDAPAVPVGSTRADQLSVGWQPYWVLVKANDILGVRTENIFGKQLLTQVRIAECTSVPDGMYGEREERRVRVLEPGGWQLWAFRRVGQNNSQEMRWVLDSQGASSLNYIPLVPFYTNRCGYYEGLPPLRTLAELNQEHWHSSSEQRRALSFLRFAMLVVTGVETKATDYDLGPDKLLTLPPGADAHYVEHSGAGMKAGADDLAAIETRMQHAGMELRVENAGRVTATAAALDSEETSAGLRAVAKHLEDAIEQALQMTAELMGIAEGGEVEVHDNFGAHEIPGTPLDVLAIRNSNNLSQTSFWSEMKRRGVLEEDFDMTAEVVLLEGEQQKNLELQQQMFEQQAAVAVPAPGDQQPPVGGQ